MSLVSVEVLDSGRRVHSVQEPLDASQPHLIALVESLRRVQQDTNSKLTEIINQTDSGDVGQQDQDTGEDEEDGEDEEEDDDTTNSEPASKIPKID